MPPSAELFTVNLYVALAAPLVGSAVAAAAMRLADGGTWGLSPSRCSACGRRLSLLELIPIVSWVAQRGKCRGCSAAISRAYPIIELGAVGVAVWAWLAVPAEVFAATCVLGWLLLALSAVDIRTRRLPDVLNLLLAVAGIATVAMIDLARVPEHLLGAALGYGAFVAVELAYRAIRKRDGLGRGDAKLLGGIGAWVGPLGLPWCIFAAGASAIVYLLISEPIRGRKVGAETDVAFGPFLAAGGWIVWVYGPLML